MVAGFSLVLVVDGYGSLWEFFFERGFSGGKWVVQDFYGCW